MADLYPKVEKKVNGSKWFIIIFIIVMLIWAISTFFEPIMQAIIGK